MSPRIIQDAKNDQKFFISLANIQDSLVFLYHISLSVYPLTDGRPTPYLDYHDQHCKNM